jgi:DNA anti-recombination protein RmuC
MENNKMQTKHNIMLSLIPTLLVFILSGCSITKEPGTFTVQPISHKQPQQNTTQPPSGSVAKRFQDPVPEKPTAIDSAMELSQKYAKLSAEAAVLHQENQDLISKNLQLKDQNAALKAQLQQTQKELTEANDLMIEMRIELNNWKTDIIGFRDEMREADSSQLQALLRILKILGGEVKTEAAQQDNATSASASTAESSPSKKI